MCQFVAELSEYFLTCHMITQQENTYKMEGMEINDSISVNGGKQIEA